MIFVPDKKTVLKSSSISYFCSSNTENPCLTIDISAFPESAIEYLLRHLEANPGHEAIIKACDIDNS